MSRKAFLTAEDGATVKFNLALSKAWRVTLGGNRTLSFVNAEKGDEVSVMLIQDSTGSRSVTWGTNVKWASGQAPALQSAGGSVDVITLRYDGTNFREVSGGGGARLPSRIAATALGTIGVVGTGIVGLTLALSGGGGQGPGNLPDGCQVTAQSGSLILMVCDGSGSILTNKYGGIAVGVGAPATDRLDKLSNSASLLPTGYFRTRNRIDAVLGLSGSSLQISDLGAAPLGSVPCVKAGGEIGYRLVTATGALTPLTCN